MTKKLIPFAGKDEEPAPRSKKATATKRERVLNLLRHMPLRRKALLLESLAWEARLEFNDKEMARVYR